MKGEIMVPSALTIVPEKFTYESANPLIPQDFSIFIYVSQKYPSDHWEALESLGARHLSAQDFLDDLSNFIKESPRMFQSMSWKWHSRLSQVLLSLTTNYGALVSSLCIVPLRNGNRTTPNVGLLLFPWASGELVPNNMNAFVVHPDAARDPSRRNLLQKLNAQDATKTEVCRIIIQTHVDPNFDPKTVPVADLISHAVFLYKARWSRESPEECLWIVNSEYFRFRSNQVYLDSCEPYSAGQLFQNYKAYFLFLHKSYAKHFSRPDDLKWLHENLGVGLIPRLVALSGSTGQTFSLSNDFRFLVDNCPALDVLQLLKVHWQYYRQWIVTEENQNAEVEPENTHHETPQSKIRAFLSLMNVQCYGSSSTRLHQTYLPRSTILQALEIPYGELKSNTSEPNCECGPNNEETTDQLAKSEQLEAHLPQKDEYLEAPSSFFPLLDVPDPEEYGWDFLEDLGVVIKVRAKDLIARLQQLRGPESTQEPISRIYQRIQAGANEEDMGLIK